METVTSICWKINFQILNASLREMCLSLEDRRPDPGQAPSITRQGAHRPAPGEGGAAHPRDQSGAAGRGHQDVTQHPRSLYQPNSIQAPSTVIGT